MANTGRCDLASAKTDEMNLGAGGTNDQAPQWQWQAAIHGRRAIADFNGENPFYGSSGPTNYRKLGARVLGCP
jgi:hypothetical protein